MTHVQEAAGAQPLNNENLCETPADVAVPSYDRSALTPGVVHIGVGSFHRAHQGMYFHDLAERGVTDWGVIGVSLRSSPMRDALEPQDLLYTVVERGADDDTVHVVGTLADYLYAREDPEPVYAALADPRIKLVTLTVTGNGYHVDVNEGRFDAAAEVVRADLEGPTCCSTFFAYVVEALDRRRRAGTPPFTVLSCDNVPRNGEVTRTAVVGFARLRDPELAEWIDRHVAFPSSMVDRITPEGTEALAEQVQREFVIGDRSPVMTEPFRQWIIEDTFCNDRPPLDRVGVQFVPDSRPYEIMKKRLLNGTHSALGYLGRLSGHGTTDEVMADPVLRAYVTRLVEEEVTPLVPEVPGVDLKTYTDTLLERLSNPKIADGLDRLCRRGSTKVPSYLLPSLADALERSRPRELLTLAVAGWLRYLRGVDGEGEPIVIDDARIDELEALLQQGGGTDPRPLLAERSIFGGLAGDHRFAAGVEHALRLLDRLGPRAAIEAYLENPPQDLAA